MELKAQKMMNLVSNRAFLGCTLHLARADGGSARALFQLCRNATDFLFNHFISAMFNNI